MKRVLLKEIFTKQLVDQEVTIKGWVRSLRKSKKFSFIMVNDGTCQRSMQIIADGVLENYEGISKMTTGYSVSITGKLVQSHGKNQSVEMQASKVEILGSVPEDYPLQKKGSTLEFLREIAHLRPRTNTFGAVFRIRHALSYATHKFFNDRGFYYIHTPLITANDGEGAGEMFQVTTLDIQNPEKIERTDKGAVDFSKDFFERGVNLAVTGQLEGEAFATGMGAIYTFGPTFRAERSNTSRHLSEFWMIEPEVAFADLDDVADLATDYLQFLISHALETCHDELEFLQSTYKEGLIETLQKVQKSKFEKITYTEAVEILAKAKADGKKFEFSCDWGSDLQTEHEKYLTDKHFELPVIVTDYPKDIKAFYMKQNDDGKTVRAMDVLVPGVGEIIGGSQREDDYEKLLTCMKDKNIPIEDLEWYLDLRKFGTVEHAGFGLGFERAVMYITGMSNVRDVIPFPRTPGNCEF